MGFVNDDASSLKFKKPGKVVIYEHDFAGKSAELVKDTACFTDVNMNDTVSSIVVFEGEFTSSMTPDDIVNSGTWTYRTERGGNDIRSLTAQTAFDCAKECAKDTQCKAIAWDNTGGKACWLKFSEGSPSPWDARDSWVKSSTAVGKPLTTSTGQTISKTIQVEEINGGNQQTDANYFWVYISNWGNAAKAGDMFRVISPISTQQIKIVSIDNPRQNNPQQLQVNISPSIPMKPYYPTTFEFMKT
jgi:hypothetical protein